MKNKLVDWTLRFVKGFFVGSGFILPGISGGALAAVFGIYERMIGFLAHITRDFWKNVRYFLPVGMGGLFSVFLLSFAVSFFLENYEVQILWCFIGCIVGTMPALWKQAGKQGRETGHYLIMAVSAVGGYLFLAFGEKLFQGALTPGFATWILAGAIVGLGVIVPGLSASNFLVYLDLYRPMTDGIKTLDPAMLIPYGIGLVGCVLAFSKLMDVVFARAYSGLFHFIFGIVLASTVMIVPLGYNYRSAGAVVCLLTCGLGVALGLWMSRLEERYKPEY